MLRGGELTLSWFIFISVVIYLLFIIFWVSKRQQTVSNTKDFLSIGPIKSSQKAYNLLGKSFEASNASFATSFLGIFVLTQINIFYSLYIVFGYLLGIYFFTKIILPKLSKHIEKGIYYPEMMELHSGSRLIGDFVSLLVILSLLAFFYAEIFSFSHGFLIDENGPLSHSSIITLSLVILLAWYTIIGGYRNIVITDFVQISVIRVGLFSLIILSLYILFSFGIAEQVMKIVQNDFISFTHFIYFPALIIGFVFAQVIYYDNWQRLILFYKSISCEDKNIDHFLNEASAKYLGSIKYLSFIFCTPILLALVAEAMGISSLYAFMSHIWEESLFGKALVLLSVLAFVSALLSTVDTYLLGMVQVLFNRFSKLNLRFIRLLIICLTVGVTPFIISKIDIAQWFTFIYYTANMQVGPVLLALLGIHFNKYVLAVSMLSALFLSVYYSGSEYIDLIAAVTIVLATSLNYITRNKKPMDAYV